MQAFERPRRAGRLIVFLLVCAAGLLGGCIASGKEPKGSLPRIDTHLGVHTRLTDEAEPAKIRRTLELVREMGAGWIVEYFPWAYHEPLPGRFEWQHADEVVGQGERLGLRVIARVDMVPAWARPAETSAKYLEPGRFDDYVRFLVAFATRYAGRIDSLVIGNEPNLALEWGFRRVAAADYAALLQKAYPAIKQVAGTPRVVLAGLAPTLEQSDLAVSELVYLRQLYEHGAGDYFDALAGHAYGWQSPPDEPPDASRINFRRLELQRQIMLEHGDGHKPILITEAGWNDHPRWTKAVRPAQRIAYTLAALDFSFSHWPWAETLSLWAFRLPVLAHNYNDYYTLVSPDFELKSIYKALRNR